MSEEPRKPRIAYSNSPLSKAEAWYEDAYKLYQTGLYKQKVVAQMLGRTQQSVSRAIKIYRRILVKQAQAQPGAIVTIPELQSELRVPGKIGEFTKLLGYTDKEFHNEWYDYASIQRRFLLLAPRRHAKSTCLSVNYVLWRIVNNPNIRILLVSNTDLQARGFVRVVKQNLEKYFPSLIPEGREKWAETAFVVKRSATLRDQTLSAVGVNGPIISRRQDLIVCDDVVDSENAESESLREKVYDWFLKVLMPTLEPNGQIIIIGTPFGPDDLYARLQIDKWPFRKYDAIVDEDKKESLWPEVLPFECAIAQTEKEHKGHCCLAAIRRQMGVIRFGAQYRCDPSGYAGNKLKIEWLKESYYRDLPEKLEIVMGVDPAISERTGADYTAITVLGYSEAEKKIYLVAYYRGHYTFPEQLSLITTTWQTHQASRIIVEATAYQAALAQGLQGMGLPVIPYRTIKDKVTRVLSISPYFENRTIRIKSDMDDFIHEYTQFDKGDHDDLLDSLTLAVQDIIERHTQWMPEYHPQWSFATVFKSKLPVPSSQPLFSQSIPQPKNTTEGEYSKGKERQLNMSTGKWEWK